MADMIPGYHDFAYLSSGYVLQRHSSFVRNANFVSMLFLWLRLGLQPPLSFLLSCFDWINARPRAPSPPRMVQTCRSKLSNLWLINFDIHALASDERSAAKVPRLAYLYGSEEPQPAPIAKSFVVTHEILAEFVSTLIRITSDSNSLMGVLSRRICFRAPAIEATVPFAPAPIPTRFD